MIWLTVHTWWVDGGRVRALRPVSRHHMISSILRVLVAFAMAALAVPDYEPVFTVTPTRSGGVPGEVFTVVFPMRDEKANFVVTGCSAWFGKEDSPDHWDCPEGSRSVEVTVPASAPPGWTTFGWRVQYEPVRSEEPGIDVLDAGEALTTSRTIDFQIFDVEITVGPSVAERGQPVTVGFT
ncbi:MAG TPA: hypothetical protein VFR35_01680, partial [Actinoplanes sp.]|nr:hypothetical protein [Actinoplanes sp.]